MRLPLSALFALVLIAAPSRAQPGDERTGGGFGLDTGYPFSAEGQGVAGAGLFGSTEDPVRAIENPAFLGDVRAELRVGGTVTNDLNGIGDLALRTGAIAGGAEQRLAGYPLTVAAGLVLSDLSSPSTSFDTSSNGVIAVGVGAGWSGPVRIRLGVGARRLSASSTFVAGPPEAESTQTIESSALTTDLGADLTLPIGRWLQPTWSAGPRVVLDLTGGAVLRGLVLSRDSRLSPGDDVFLLEPTADRSPALGGRARLGLGLGTRARPLLAASVEALADDATIGGDDVELLGGRLTILETLTVSAGSFEGGSFLPRSTTGLSLSVGGLLRAVGTLTDDPRLYDRGARFDIRLDIADQEFDDDRPGDGIFGDARTVGLVLRVRR